MTRNQAVSLICKRYGVNASEGSTCLAMVSDNWLARHTDLDYMLPNWSNLEAVLDHLEASGQASLEELDRKAMGPNLAAMPR